MHKYNWGIIGTGWIAHEMADALNEVNGEIYAVSNLNEESLYKFAKEKNVKHTFINPDEMITDPDVDIIYIATPHISHYDYIKKALNAGKHVFAEKAITISAKQPKRGVISGTKGYVEINNYPRATEAKVTYTLDAHTESHETITAGDSAKALNYEVMDMQRYISQGHDDGQLSLSQDVAHILNRVRDNWGMNYTN